MRKAILLALACAAFGGCASTPPAASTPEDQARAAVSSLVADYQSNNAEAFIGRLDAETFPNVAAFSESVRDFLLHNHQINLDLIVDAVMEEAGAVAVETHWNRSVFDASGSLRRQSGRAELIFRSSPSGMLLSAIHGDSPF